jgi:hypothetical protein
VLLAKFVDGHAAPVRFTGITHSASLDFFGRRLSPLTGLADDESSKRVSMDEQRVKRSWVWHNICFLVTGV